MSDIPQKALSVRQPWAWAILNGKDIENRSIAAVRHGMKTGRIALHASKGMTQDEYESARDFMESIGISCPRPDELIRGAIIGVVTVTEIVAEHKSPWFFGPRGLVLSDQVEVSPIPAQGALGYFDWNLGSEIDGPKPWMIAWPETAKRKSKVTPIAKPEPMPLFTAATGVPT